MINNKIHYFHFIFNSKRRTFTKKNNLFKKENCQLFILSWKKKYTGDSLITPCGPRGRLVGYEKENVTRDERAVSNLLVISFLKKTN
jgi:hypothetical protein